MKIIAQEIHHISVNDKPSIMYELIIEDTEKNRLKFMKDAISDFRDIGFNEENTLVNELIKGNSNDETISLKEREWHTPQAIQIKFITKDEALSTLTKNYSINYKATELIFE